MKKRLTAFLCICILALSFTGCQTVKTGAGTETEESGSHESSGQDEESSSEAGRETGSVNLEAKQNDSLSEANNRFAWEIFKKLNDEDSGKNIFISPLSISAALTMALNGAEGSTKEAMERVLEYGGMTRDEINTGYKYLLNRLENLDEKIQLNISNSIWIRDGQGYRIRGLPPRLFEECNQVFGRCVLQDRGMGYFQDCMARAVL